MLFSLLVSLYTSRVILNALGTIDYGVNNVVGGVVTMFSFLSGTMATAIQRFLSFDLGTGNINTLKKTFNVSNTILVVLCFIILLVVETVGLGLLNHKLVIPSERIVAAKYVFQFSTLSLLIQILSVPYNAAIVAHEKMSAFAYIGILDVILRFIVAITIKYVSSIDKLILYSALLCAISLLIRFLYVSYCKMHFEECRNVRLYYERTIGRKMYSFFGWNTIGSFAYVAKEQGVNTVINMFCGPIVNAARGVNAQVTGAIYGFISNFQVAVNPQITKYYSVGDMGGMCRLVFQAAKYSFLLFYFLSLPIFLDIDYILKLWLVNVPEHTSNFVRLTIILMLIETISYPIITSLLAIGKVKVYQIIVGLLLLLNLPISYFLLKFGYEPESTIIVAISLSAISLLVRLVLVYKYISFPVKDFLLSVVVRVIIVSILSGVISYIIYRNIICNELIKLILVSAISWLIVALCVYFVGFDQNERNTSIRLFKKLIKKI